MPVDLTPEEREMLSGERGPGTALAMKVMVDTAAAMGATRLLEITSAHIDGCLYHGQAGLDFARALADGGARVTVPTTLNVASLDLLHPDLVQLDDETRTGATSLMDAYVDMGCAPTWTCAPYHLEQRPGRGEQVAWAESNAIVFANSVLGARTERYGDFMDICAAVTGRAPAVGLHLDEGRQPALKVDVTGIKHLCEREEAAYPLIGHIVGREAGQLVPVLSGLPESTTEEDLKSMGAAAASSGSVALFHAVALTPEAPSDSQLDDMSLPVVRITEEDLHGAHDDLTTAQGGEVDAVSVGTPHYSVTQLRRLERLLAGRRCSIPLFVSAGRDSLEAFGSDSVERLRESGVEWVTDTCTYITPILGPQLRVVMTDSAKWAYYAPANLGVEVVFGSMRACVETAVDGRSAYLW